MKHLTITLGLLAAFAIGHLQAQRFNAKKVKSFTVWKVEGAAQYTKKGAAEKMPITPGMAISNDLELSLNENAAVRLVNAHQIVSISGKGDYMLNSNLKNNTAKVSNATKPFFELLVASSMYNDAKMTAVDDGAGYGDKSKKKKGNEGDGYGDKSKKEKGNEGDGYGDKSKKKKGNEGDGYGDKSKKKKGNEGDGYGDKSKKVKKANKTKKKSILRPLKSDSIYKQGKKVDKLLMKAAALDNAGLNSDAQKLYQKALKKKPNDPVANQMHRAFKKRTS
ncbi:MAG: hypothetical protein AAFZ15_11500 [Bacteroidota bacterium]